MKIKVKLKLLSKINNGTIYHLENDFKGIRRVNYLRRLAKNHQQKKMRSKKKIEYGQENIVKKIWSRWIDPINCTKNNQVKR